MLWILRTGAPWRAVPECYGRWQTVYSRFRLWRRTGVHDAPLAALQEGADAQGRLDWALHHVNGTPVQQKSEAHTRNFNPRTHW